MSKFYIDASGRKRAIGPRCGTPSGYNLHTDVDEKPCDACILAKREYDANYRAQPANTQRNRAAANAQMAAYRDLCHRYKAEYDALYAGHKARIFAERGIKPRSRVAVNADDTTP